MNNQRTFSNGIRRGRSDVPNWRSGAITASRGGYQNHVTSNSSSPPSGARAEDDEIHGNRGGAHDNPVHGRLLFLTMCLVGQLVDVQLKDGSVFSGIFHTANLDKDFSVVLKMAKQVKEVTGKSSKGATGKQASKKPPLKMLIIYAEDLVQIIAKDVLLTGEALPNGRSREAKNELLTDSLISQNRRESERVLKPWKPDNDAPRNLGLESTFQNSWHRNWDQFETNKNLFGVETTFNEELYTTKLERGPQTRDLEKVASRLAKEIEGETTKNPHLAEERGVSDPELDDLDEESRFSSVLRRPSEGEDDHDSKSDSHGSGAPSSETAQGSGSPPLGPSVSPRSSASAGDAGLQTLAPIEDPPRENRDQKKGRKDQVNDLKSFSESLKDRNVKSFDGRLPKASSTVSKLADDLKNAELKSAGESSTKVTAPIHAPPASALPIPVGLGSVVVTSSSSSVPTPSRSPKNKAAPALPSEPSREDAEQAPAAVKDGSLAPAPGSTTGAVKMSALNPNAKEFKLNPNAKVFTPSFSAPRPASPIAQQSPVYVPATVPVTPMHGMPVFVQQPGQFAQYNSTMAVATGVTTAPYTPLHGYPPPNYQGMIPGQPLQVPLPPQPSSQLAQPPQKHSGGETNLPSVLVGQSPVRSPVRELRSPAPALALARAPT